ncbi:ABC-type transport auxiliary lipoprotein family protein [Vulcaniibacterium tengchongense]|uniref:Cholesterol transport system auxiliary component n=1 Tax=Vulcaniibacterium tengchongense TaxID=1273429 RepID=A0A3N4W312_9GAMM|nr:ABC-type transport auxiliary lipoprotein family protein [Vulcaniibacterium tengchongense]RPE79584.1 cholesterol transport system auxiliary component [Vulcaniibacterium tengchongense]
MSTGRPPSFARPLLAGLLALAATGCSVLGNSTREASTIYDPEPELRAEPGWPAVDWQLALPPPNAARMIDSLRIAVRPQPNELQVYKGAQWARPPSEMLSDALLRTFEASGKLPGAARQGSGLNADYRLLLELRRFESDYGAQGAAPAATIEVAAKLLHAQDQRIVAARSFARAQPAASAAVPDVVEAFRLGLGELAHELAGWTLASGAAHERDAHRQRP